MKWVKRGLLVLLALALVGSLVRAFLPKPVEVELHRMLGPVSAPVVVQADLDGFELLINAVGKEFLNAYILCEGDMRALIEQKTAGIAE